MASWLLKCWLNYADAGYNTNTMRQAVRAVVVRNGYLLAMHRNKFGQEYYTLPGGGMKPGEQAEHALLRQMQEESFLYEEAQKRIIIINTPDELIDHL